MATSRLRHCVGLGVARTVTREKTWIGRCLAAIFCMLLSGTLHGADPDGESKALVFTPAPTVRNPESQQLLDITRAGERILAVGAAGLIVVSDDEGDSWRQVPGVPVSTTLTAVTFPTPTRGWAVGHGGVILATEDAGETWHQQFDGYRGAEAFLDFARMQRSRLQSQLDAMEADSDLSENSAELEELAIALDDALFIEEEALLAVENGPADPFLDVAFFDAMSGLAVGAYGMSFLTTDGGANWAVNQQGIDNIERFHLYGLHIEDSLVTITGEAGLLFQSRDRGYRFRRFYDVYEGSLFGAVPIAAGLVSYGLRGNVFLQSRPGGEWRELHTRSESSLYGAVALSDGGALLLGAGGMLVRLSDDGEARLFQHPGRSTFSSGLEGHEGEIWLVGMGGVARFSRAVAQ
ncbi:YCF48-related protein [Congregibacter litoralis]|uniref:Photosynthesis system II assembly factor Ycf48/Hcf136-like domain-containing protein n=1 Tax=Congregibacter litoralis KT71 TaxID=314285 RepID=A4A827_9GAMM|nr:YCF48-related protein [Congregibacter litoralis]EAQ97822.2 Uncharacterized protein KT71_14669 [Congregibacter litoralis KT71]